MKLEDIRARIEVLEEDVNNICSSYDLDELKRNQKKYLKLKRRNHVKVSTQEMKMIKEHRAVYSNVVKKKKKLSELKKHLDDVIERMHNDGCCNFKRKNTNGRDHMSWTLNFILLMDS